MPLPRVHRVVQDSLGNVVPQVLCSVLLEGTGTLATLWQDDAGTIPLSNPMTSDSTYGSFDFYVQPAHYDLSFTKPGYTFQPLLDMQVPQDDLTLGTMAQQDASAVAITGGTGTFDQLTSRGGVEALDSGGEFQVAFAGRKSAGANRWNLFCDGTANNYLQGKLSLGTATPHFGSQLTINWRHADTNGIALQVIDSDTGLYTALAFLNVGGGVVGLIATTATTTAYNTTSDVRLKHAIAPLTGALDVVRVLRPVHFLWNANDEPGEGFLAHELMRHVPAAVTGEPDEVHPDGSIKPQGVDHSRLVPWLTAALQDAVAQLAALAARVASLEEQLGI